MMMLIPLTITTVLMLTRDVHSRWQPPRSPTTSNWWVSSLVWYKPNAPKPTIYTYPYINNAHCAKKWRCCVCSRYLLPSSGPLQQQKSVQCARCMRVYMYRMRATEESINWHTIGRSLVRCAINRVQGISTQHILCAARDVFKIPVKWRQNWRISLSAMIALNWSGFIDEQVVFRKRNGSDFNLIGGLCFILCFQHKYLSFTLY